MIIFRIDVQKSYILPTCLSKRKRDTLWRNTLVSTANQTVHRQQRARRCSPILYVTAKCTSQSQPLEQ